MTNERLFTPGGLFGVRLIEERGLTIGPLEDWSEVRAPSRAKRRRARGFPQRIRFYYKPDPKILVLPDGTLVGHPDTIMALRDQMASLSSSESARQIRQAISQSS